MTTVSHFLLKNYYQNQKLRKKLQQLKKKQQRRNQLNLVLRNSKKEQKAQQQRSQELRKKKKKKNQNNGYLVHQVLHSETYSRDWISKLKKKKKLKRLQRKRNNNLNYYIKKESGCDSGFFLFLWFVYFRWKSGNSLSCKFITSVIVFIVCVSFNPYEFNSVFIC